MLYVDTSKQLGENYYEYDSVRIKRDINEGLVEPFKDLMNRPSKMMRPLVIDLFSDFLGVKNQKMKFATEAFIEIFHNNTLIIDDI